MFNDAADQGTHGAHKMVAHHAVCDNLTLDAILLGGGSCIDGNVRHDARRDNGSDLQDRQ